MTVHCIAALGQAGMGNLARGAGKRFWMSEYASGDFDVTDIKAGLQLSTQVSCLDLLHHALMHFGTCSSVCYDNAFIDSFIQNTC